MTETQAKHNRFRLAMNEALRTIADREAKARAAIARAEFLRNRSPADAYVLAEYKWPYK